MTSQDAAAYHGTGDRRATTRLAEPRADVQKVLNALVVLGLARRLDDNRYAT